MKKLFLLTLCAGGITASLPAAQSSPTAQTFLKTEYPAIQNTFTWNKIPLEDDRHWSRNRESYVAIPLAHTLPLVHGKTFKLFLNPKPTSVDEKPTLRFGDFCELDSTINLVICRTSLNPGTIEIYNNNRTLGQSDWQKKESLLVKTNTPYEMCEVNLTLEKTIPVSPDGYLTEPMAKQIFKMLKDKGFTPASIRESTSSAPALMTAPSPARSSVSPSPVSPANFADKETLKLQVERKAEESRLATLKIQEEALAAAEAKRLADEEAAQKIKNEKAERLVQEEASRKAKQERREKQQALEAATKAKKDAIEAQRLADKAKADLAKKEQEERKAQEASATAATKPKKKKTKNKTEQTMACASQETQQPSSKKGKQKANDDDWQIEAQALVQAEITALQSTIDQCIDELAIPCTNKPCIHNKTLAAIKSIEGKNFEQDPELLQFYLELQYNLVKLYRNQESCIFSPEKAIVICKKIEKISTLIDENKQSLMEYSFQIFMGNCSNEKNINAFCDGHEGCDHHQFLIHALRYPAETVSIKIMEKIDLVQTICPHVITHFSIDELIGLQDAFCSFWIKYRANNRHLSSYIEIMDTWLPEGKRFDDRHDSDVVSLVMFKNSLELEEQYDAIKREIAIKKSSPSEHPQCVGNNCMHKKLCSLSIKINGKENPLALDWQSICPSLDTRAIYLMFKKTIDCLDSLDDEHNMENIKGKCFDWKKANYRPCTKAKLVELLPHYLQPSVSRIELEIFIYDLLFSLHNALGNDQDTTEIKEILKTVVNTHENELLLAMKPEVDWFEIQQFIFFLEYLSEKMSTEKNQATINFYNERINEIKNLARYMFKNTSEKKYPDLRKNLVYIEQFCTAELLKRH